MTILALLDKPMVLHFYSLLWLLMPLCIAVAIIYKTVRTHDLSRLGWEIVRLVIYMAGGLVCLGLVLWLVHEYWPFP